MTNKHHQPRYISTPPVRWTNFCEIVFTKKITMILFVLIFVNLIQNSVALRARSGHTNPWGENQRPKLYTDYLTKHSGKTIFLYFFDFEKKHEKNWHHSKVGRVNLDPLIANSHLFSQTG